MRNLKHYNRALFLALGLLLAACGGEGSGVIPEMKIEIRDSRRHPGTTETISVDSTICPDGRFKVTELDTSGITLMGPEGEQKWEPGEPFYLDCGKGLTYEMINRADGSDPFIPGLGEARITPFYPSSTGG